jgi:hypothetical protein
MPSQTTYNVQHLHLLYGKTLGHLTRVKHFLPKNDKRNKDMMPFSSSIANYLEQVTHLQQ